jgi:hypothetical protein
VRRTGIIAAVVAVLTALTMGVAQAGPSSGILVKPWTFALFTSVDDVESQWVTHEGLPDSGRSDHALYLQKIGPTADISAAGAEVDGVEGTQLVELGFDVRNDGHCGAGAPRFNVVTTDDVTHFFGCVYGTHTPVNADWTRVRFTGADGLPPVLPGDTVQSVDIVFDEGTDVGQGFVYLDNIDYNGTIAGKPGLAK